MGGVNNFNDLLNYVLRQRYYVVERLHTIDDTIKFLSYYFTNVLQEQYPFLLIYLMIPGAIILFIKDKYSGLTGLAALIITIGAIAVKVKITSGLEFIVKPYLIFTYLFIAIFITYFFYYVVMIIKNKIIKNTLFYILPVIIILLIILRIPDYSRYYLAYDYSKNLFLTIPDKSIYFAEGDLNINSVIYLDLIEKRKTNYVISIFLENNWYRDKLKLNKNIIVPDSFTKIDDYIDSMMIANKMNTVLYSNAFTKSYIRYPVIIRGITQEIIFDNKKDVLSDPYLFFNIYALRGILDNKINYDDATRVFVLEAYGKCLVKIAKIYEQNNDERAYFYYIWAFNFYKNDTLAVKIAQYYIKNFQNEKAQYYLKEALKINKNNQTAKNLLGL
ncbi:MAG: hypothetical protein N3E50_03475 [Candidatus Goldbacteria bacterium]|nr:hypothetical protein [Candidatus Goldiibacteriota bacterium]